MQGLIEFAALLEQAEQSHRERILEQAAEEEPELVRKVLKKIVLFEEIVYLDEGVLSELLAKVSPKVLAWAVHGRPAKFRDTLFACLDFRKRKAFLAEEDRLPEKLPEKLLIGARRQVLKIARRLENEGKFSLDLTGCPRLQTRRRA